MVILDKIVGLVVKALYHTLRNFLLFIIFFRYTFEDYNSNRLLITSFILYLLFMFITKKVIMTSENRSRYSKFTLFINIIISILLSIFSFYKLPSFIFGLGILYFFFLSTNAIKSNLEKEFYSNELRNAFITLILSIVMILLGRLITNEIINDLFNYLMLYFLTGVIYISRINLDKEYRSESYDTVNKKKNLPMLNTITIVLVFLLFFFRNYALLTIVTVKNFIVTISKYIAPLVSKIIYYILYVLSFLIDKFINFIKSRISYVEQNEIEKGAKEETFDFIGENNQQAIDIIEAILHIVFFVIILLIIVKIIREVYKSIMKYMIEKSYTDDIEEKEFIIKKSDIIKYVKDRFIKAFNSSKDDLHPIRKEYKEVTNNLINKGYIYSNNFTPNEYLDQIPDKEINNLSYENLTKKYNDYRYGEKN